MTTLTMATADLNTAALSGTTLSTEQKRTGTYSYRLSPSADYLNLPIEAKSIFYFRTALYLSSIVTIQFREGTVIHIQLTVEPLGLIKVFRSTTIIGTASFLIPINTWFVLEGKIIIHDTTGRITLRINGVEIYDLIDVDTRNNWTGTCDNLHILSGTSGIKYVDDIVIDDANYPGLGGIEVLLPNADGTNIAWTGGFADVDDNPSNDDTDYIYTDPATPDIKETFTFPDCNAATAGVPRIGLVTRSKLDAAGAGTIKPMLNADIPAGTALSTSYQWVNRYYDADPADAGAWTKAKVDAIEAGVST